MAPTKFSIILDNSQGSYFPGETITGKVIISLDQEKNTQGLRLKINGEAEVDWQESQGQSGSKGFQAEETYFRSKIILLGDEKNSDIVMSAGTHEYPFTFELPENLPSSFEGPFGHVRYDMEAVVKRSWKFDYNTKILFTVNALVDLNLQRVYFEPIDSLKEKSIMCLCCKEGPISMRVEMKRTGYVAGEIINFTVHSSNSSSRPVSAVVVYFLREIIYRAQGRSKSTTEEMKKIRGPEIQPFLSETWQEKIHIPPIPPSNLGGCKIIDMRYLLKFKLDIPSSIDLKKKIPILVGTIPFTEFFDDLNRASSTSHNLQITSARNREAQLPPEMNSSAAPFPVIPSSLLSKYSNMPLPVFQDAVKFDNEEESKCSGNTPSPSHNASSRGETPTPEDVERRYLPKYATYDYNYRSKLTLDVPDQSTLN